MHGFIVLPVPAAGTIGVQCECLSVDNCALCALYRMISHVHTMSVVADICVIIG